jgi:hypothetical protein
MRVNKALSMCKAISKAGFGVLGWAVLGAAVGATAAGLYGALYGTLDGLIHGDLWRLASAGRYFALCGAVAGALVGGFGRMIDPEGVADLTSRSPQGTGRRDVVFLRPSPLANPPIARRRFLEGSSSEGSRRIKEPSMN